MERNGWLLLLFRGFSWLNSVDISFFFFAARRFEQVHYHHFLLTFKDFCTSRIERFFQLFSCNKTFSWTCLYCRKTSFDNGTKAIFSTAFVTTTTTCVCVRSRTRGKYYVQQFPLHYNTTSKTIISTLFSPPENHGFFFSLVEFPSPVQQIGSWLDCAGWWMSNKVFSNNMW